MEFFNEFEIIDGIIPNLIGLAIFLEWLFISIKLEKQKSDVEKKSPLINKKDSFVKIMYQRFLITLPSAYIHEELNDLNAR